MKKYIAILSVFALVIGFSFMGAPKAEAGFFNWGINIGFGGGNYDPYGYDDYGYDDYDYGYDDYGYGGGYGGYDPYSYSGYGYDDYGYGGGYQNYGGYYDPCGRCGYGYMPTSRYW